MDELECKAFELDYAQMLRYNRSRWKQQFWNQRERIVAKQIATMRKESRTYRPPYTRIMREVAS